MRTLAEVMWQRTNKIRHDKVYRMRMGLLALSYDRTHQDEISGQEEPPPVVEHIVRHSNMTAQEFALLQEHERALKYLLGKAKEKVQPKVKAKYT